MHAISSLHYPDMSINGIPHSILENLPAGTPPPGVQPNFIDPPSRANLLIALNAVFMTLAWSVVAMRLYAKGKIQRMLGWEDCESVHILISNHLAPNDSLQILV